MTLQEALDIVERSVAYVDAQMREHGVEPADDATYIVLEAARLVAQADEWLVCEVHQSRWFGEECEYAYIKDYDGPPNDCRMVRRRLLPPEEQA